MYILTSILAVFICLFIAWSGRRSGLSYFLRPSTAYTLLVVLVYVFPILVFNGQLESVSPRIDQVGLVLCTVLILSCLFSYSTQHLVKLQMQAYKGDSNTSVATRLLFFLVLGLVLIVGAYFTQQKFNRTGLFALICSPQNYVYFREQSMKLLEAKWLRYLYLIGYSCLIPFVVALVVDGIIKREGILRKRMLIWSIPIIALGIFYLLITGARVGLLNCALATGGVFFVRYSKLKFLGLFGAAVITGVATAALIGMLSASERSLEVRQSWICKDADESVFEEVPYAGYLGGIFNRIFVIPSAVAGFYFEEFTSNGPGYKRLTGGVRSVSNEISLKYGSRLHHREAVDSSTMPTTFVFANFYYFGYWSLLLSALGVLLLDLPLLLAKRLSGNLFAPIVSVNLYFTIIFAQSSYGVVLLSHGFLVFICIVSILLIIDSVRRRSSLCS